MCDQCGEVLGPLTKGGDDQFGERGGWIQLVTSSMSADLCTRACVVELISDGSDWTARHDSDLAAITEVARMIREDHER